MADSVIVISDIVSGNIDNYGRDIEQSNRLRAEGYIALPTPSPSNLSVEIVASTGKPVDVELRGYISNGQSVATTDQYWFTSPTTFDLSSYGGIAFIRLVFRYSDNSIINPSEIISCTVTVREYVWYMGEDGCPTNNLFPDLPSGYMVAPFPDAVWRINGGYPFHKLMPEVPLLGAFANAINLRTVRIPETVKKIGRYAFCNTQLASVTIASDCEYYDTSFPDGCVINFY